MTKTKPLISFAVTAKLISAFVFAYEKSRFSNDAAHFVCYICHVVAFRIPGDRMFQYIEHALFTLCVAILLSVYFRKGRNHFLKVIVLALKVSNGSSGKMRS